jgi:RND superfamily putative drug exporter
VEGEGLAHQVSLASWPTPDDPHLVSADGLVVELGAGRETDGLELSLMPHEILVVEGPSRSGKTSLMLTLSGRMRLVRGRVKIAGRVLPEQAGAVRRTTGFVDCATVRDVGELRTELRTVQAARPAVIFVDHVQRLTATEDRAALASLLDEVAFSDREQAVVLASDDRESVSDLMPTHYSYLDLGRVAELAPAQPNPGDRTDLEGRI